MFSMVFLEDGGLLGLKNLQNKGFETILFINGSYLQRLFGIFKKKKIKPMIKLPVVQYFKTNF